MSDSLSQSTGAFIFYDLLMIHTESNSMTDISGDGKTRHRASATQ